MRPQRNLRLVEREPDEDEGATEPQRKVESVGRPVGPETFLAVLETSPPPPTRPQARPKPKNNAAASDAK